MRENGRVCILLMRVASHIEQADGAVAVIGCLGL